MKYFEHFTLGLEAEAPGKHIVTEEEIIEFGTRWDSQPFHVDPEAAKDSLFGGLVACSVHLFAMAIGLWNRATVTFRNEVTNQNGELVIAYESAALIQKDPAEVGGE